MAQDEIQEEAQQLPSLSPDGKALIEQIIDSVFEVDEVEALPLIEHHITTLDPQAAGTAYEALIIVLQSLWNLFTSSKKEQVEGDFASALVLLQSAVQGFEQVGEEELRDLSIGLYAYAQAVIEIQNKNIGQSLELFKQVKDYLQKAGKFSSMFQPIIDSMKPSQLFVAAVIALMNYDFASAGSLTNQASQAVVQLANSYYKQEEPLHSTFLGMSHFYKAYFIFFEAMSELNQFKYDKLAGEYDLAREAIQAQELLDKGDTENVGFRNVSRISNSLAQLSEFITELSKLMLTVFSSTFKPDLKALTNLRQKLRTAKNSLNEVGEQAAALVRFCDQLSDQVDNLEKLAKPSRKDFGIFSGLVACALFLPLFLVVAWTNTTFGIKLNSYTLITSCLVLAIIGGFGFGALKFKSLIFPKLNANDSSGVQTTG